MARIESNAGRHRLTHPRATTIQSWANLDETKHHAEVLALAAIPLEAFKLKLAARIKPDNEPPDNETPNPGWLLLERQLSRETAIASDWRPTGDGAECGNLDRLPTEGLMTQWRLRYGGSSHPLTVYDGNRRATGLIRPLAAGFEALDLERRSLGLFPTRPEAADALEEAVSTTGIVIPFPRRGPWRIEIVREGDAYLVFARDHGWLPGDYVSALAGAEERLAANHARGSPYRNQKLNERIPLAGRRADENRRRGAQARRSRGAGLSVPGRQGAAGEARTRLQRRHH